MTNTHYTTRRKEQLAKVNKENENNPHLLHDKLTTSLKCFIKDESYPNYKHLRSILARHDRFKVMVGPIFKKIEKALFKRPEFIKSIPVRERPKFLLNHFGFYDVPLGVFLAGTDYTAFESHFTPELMEACEMQFYRYMTQNLPQGPNWFKLVQRVLEGENRCMFKNLGFRIPASRMSGEMNTSLGNSFTNWMVFLFLNQRAGNTGVKCVIEGDDCLGSFSGRKLTKEDFALLGFSIKVDYFPCVGLASFCGLIFDAESLSVSSDPTKIIQEFGWVSHLYKCAKPIVFRELMKSKAMSMMCNYVGSPILQSLAQAVLGLTYNNRYRVSAEYNWYERTVLYPVNNVPSPRPVTMGSRLLMEKVFGYSPAEQIALENYFSSLKDLVPFSHPIIYSKVHPDSIHYNNIYVQANLKFCSANLRRIINTTENEIDLQCRKERISRVEVDPKERSLLWKLNLGEACHHLLNLDLLRKVVPRPKPSGALLGRPLEWFWGAPQVGL